MRRTAVSRVSLLTVGFVLGVALVAPGTGPAGEPASAEPSGQAARGAACPDVERAFRPARVTIPGVVGSTRVLALGRDRNGAPRTPPLTAAGRWQLAWDRASGVRPGGRYGVVRLNAHTYPRSGAYGSALGNRLLGRLHRGDRIVVTGADGQRLCYSVVRRTQVRAGRPLLRYYADSGPARLAVLVCSGKRRGPGDWSHRTIWFARPVR